MKASVFSCLTQRVIRNGAPTFELQDVRCMRRPLLAMVRGDDAASALRQPIVEPTRKRRACLPIEPGKWLVEQCQRGLARPGSREQYPPRLSIRHLGERTRPQGEHPEAPQCALRMF